MANVLFLFHLWDMQNPTRNPKQQGPGRAAVSNRQGRFEAHAREVFSDGWDLNEDRMATEKLSDGIRSFVADQRKLEQLLRDFDA